MTRTIQQILFEDIVYLIKTLALDTDSARIEVQCLLQKVLTATRAYLLAHPERCLSKQEQARYDELFQRRLRGEPIAYLLGEREFFGLSFKVTPDTLIPRPETELLVELALQRISSHPLPACRPPSPACGRGRKGEGNRQGRGEAFRVLDLGTGSGAIALTIAHQHPEIEVLACDISAAALDIARQNAQHLGIVNAAFVLSDWFQSFTAKRFNIIVANPPYVAANDPHLTRGDVRFEPVAALIAGEDGLHDIRRIIRQAPDYLEAGGWLLLEHGYDQAASVRKLLQQAGLCEVFSARDLSGIERVSGARA